MWWKVITTIAITIGCVAQLAAAETIAVKPSTPVEISIVPESAVYPGAVVAFLVRASSSLPSENLLIQANLPQGSELVSGDLQWLGSVMPGQTRELRFSLRLSSGEVPAVHASASIQSPTGAQMAASAVYRQADLAPAGILKANQERKVNRNGQPVVEYSIK